MIEAETAVRARNGEKSLTIIATMANMNDTRIGAAVNHRWAD